MKVSLAVCLAQNEHQPNLFASTITKADLKGLKISFNIDFYNYYKALVHTQPSIVLLPGIHTTMYIL